MRGSLEELAKAFCNTHCNVAGVNTDKKKGPEIYQIQQFLLSLQTIETNYWLGMSWALRKIFKRQQTCTAPKYVRIADDKGNLFVLKKSRQTWSSTED